MNKKQIPPIVIGIKSEEERELLKQQAENAGRKLSDYCRRKLLGLDENN